MSKVKYSTEIPEIEDRSDFDAQAPHRHQIDKLGEALGDGFFVQEEPVLVHRDKQGRIVRTEPLSEARFSELLANEKNEEQIDQEGRAKEEFYLANPVPIPRPLTTSAREKLVHLMAERLFRWYEALGPQVDTYNPVYDGIPDNPTDQKALQPPPGTNLYPASGHQVFEWLKRVISVRAEFVNKKTGTRGVRADLSDAALRLHRKPIRR